MSSPEKNLIEVRVRELPASPGVYLMKNAAGEIIYVGKAAHLKNRVRSYFSEGYLPPKTQRMVQVIRDIDFYITGSEEEALIFELNLIKRHRPYYNVRLKDDKGFPYIKIDLQEDWPRIQVVRRLGDDVARYFGPFANSNSIRQALDVARLVFHFRSCNLKLEGNNRRPCLEYDMHHCSAPCAGFISIEEYQEAVNGLILFLEGRQAALQRKLNMQMKQSAELRQFEKAARLRDRIKAVTQIVNWQKMATKVRGDQDVIAFAQDKDLACVQVFMVRNGELIGREKFTLQGTNAEEPSQIMSGFVEQYYATAFSIPSLILLQHPIVDKLVVQRWLTMKSGVTVRLVVPVKGLHKELLDTVVENAIKGLEQLKLKKLAQPLASEKAMQELKEKINLPELPVRIEGYDISNIQGEMAVGSMVVFENGIPKPANYRRFRIKSVYQANDYAMLQEVIKRRFGNIENKLDGNNWAVLPSLVLIDGGRGQLSSANDAIKKAVPFAIPIVSLAKENEEIFSLGRVKPIILPASSPGLQLLQRVRDEAHRFALGYHYKLRKREAFTSVLDSVPGIGPRRKIALLKHFGSIDRIKDASLEALTEIPGITIKLAQKIKEYI
jgi:excinuclease ABC subunit C